MTHKVDRLIVDINRLIKPKLFHDGILINNQGGQQRRAHNIVNKVVKIIKQITNSSC